MVRAVVYIPPDLPLEGRYAEECEAYVARRDYELAGIMRDWDAVEWLLVEHRAEVVVFFQAPSQRVRMGSAEYVDRMTTLRLWTGKPHRVRREPTRWTTQDVRQALSGDMPVQGVDRTSIEALRRIAHHLRECFGDEPER